MLSIRNIREMNRQITNELRTVNSILSSDEEKTAALNRIAQLKAILDQDTSSPKEPTAAGAPSSLIGAIFGVAR